MGVILLRRFVPTNGENVFQRLWLRYFICYLLAVAVEILLVCRGHGLAWSSKMACLLWLTVPLSLLAALLTVGNAYLLLLTVLKGALDAALLYRLTLLVQTHTIRILDWNLCFFLLAASLLIYLFSAVTACRFAFDNDRRDFRLICSKPFAVFCLKALYLTALAWLIFFFFLQLGARIPALLFV